MLSMTIIFILLSVLAILFLGRFFEKLVGKRRETPRTRVDDLARGHGETGYE